MKYSYSRCIFALLSGAALTACGAGEKAGEHAIPSISGVRLERVQLEGLPQSFEAVGTVRSASTSVLGAEISGTVSEIRVNAGDHVRRGEILAILDDRGPRSQLAAAEAALEESKEALIEAENALRAATADRKLAELTYRRYQNLLGKNSITREEYDGAEARYQSAVANQTALEARKRQVEAHGRVAESQRESARTNFSYSRIASPLNGVVSARSVDPGTLVMPGAPILTIEDTSRYRLEASVPEDLIRNIHVGQKVSVWTEHAHFPARLVEIVPAADPGSRTFLVKIALPPAASCRSGEYGKATFELREHKVIAVPRSAVFERGQIEGVYVVSPHQIAEYRLVKTGKSLGSRVEVLSGLSEGEQVATSQLDRLTDGTRVEAR
jgi:RND family efflux transporter MFP subunit